MSKEKTSSVPAEKKTAAIAEKEAFVSEEFPGRPTNKQIKAWKDEHGRCPFAIVDGGLLFIMRNPKLADHARARLVKKKYPKDVYALENDLITNCKLYADPGFMEDDDNLLALMPMMDELITFKEVETGEL